MRISDWSSDVCSSDLPQFHADLYAGGRRLFARRVPQRPSKGGITASRRHTRDGNGDGMQNAVRYFPKLFGAGSMTENVPAFTCCTSRARSATPLLLKRNAPSMPETPSGSASWRAGKGELGRASGRESAWQYV